MAKYEKLTCLIADDYSTARRIIKQYLNDLGFSCLEADDGEQAMAAILQNPLNLVLADIKMSKKNGLELLEAIRDDDNLKDLPVILTMIEPIEDMIKAGLDLGMNDYLVKPFDVFTLAKVLEKVIETEGGETLQVDNAKFKRIRCTNCVYYKVTWDADNPYGCKKLGFKSKVEPSTYVIQISGKICHSYSSKKAGE